jgi:4-hydroxy 2-oxovalerate aldolase
VRSESSLPYVVDVTLRDGGYLNAWQFSRQQIKDIVYTLDEMRLDIVEVGYLNQNRHLALAACTPPELLTFLLANPLRISIAAMLRPSECCDEIFTTRHGLLTLIRIPCAVNNVSIARRVAEQATLHGFKAAINLTSISAYNQKEVMAAVIDLAKGDPPLHSVYFADSRGALGPSDVRSLIQSAAVILQVPIGFHGHDNRRLAIDNSVASLSAGASYIDASLDGLGLGGGNADLRELLRALGRPTDVPSAVFLSLGIHGRDRLQHLYTLAGKKNLEQEWIALLVDEFRDHTESLLSRLPRRKYKSYDAVQKLLSKYQVET